MARDKSYWETNGSRRYVLKPDDVGELERESGVHEFVNRNPRDKAEDMAYGDYTKKHHTQAAAHHLAHMRGSQANGNYGDAKRHKILYDMHLKQLGLDSSSGKVPEEIAQHMNNPDAPRPMKFKPHHADSFFLNDEKSAPQELSKAEVTAKLAKMLNRVLAKSVALATGPHAIAPGVAKPKEQAVQGYNIQLPGKRKATTNERRRGLLVPWQIDASTVTAKPPNLKMSEPAGEEAQLPLTALKPGHFVFVDAINGGKWHPVKTAYPNFTYGDAGYSMPHARPEQQFRVRSSPGADLTQSVPVGESRIIPPLAMAGLWPTPTPTVHKSLGEVAWEELVKAMVVDHKIGQQAAPGVLSHPQDADDTVDTSHGAGIPHHQFGFNATPHIPGKKPAPPLLPGKGKPVIPGRAPQVLPPTIPGRVAKADIDPKQLVEGSADEEEEHSLGPAISGKIAGDHLKEDPNYYKKAIPTHYTNPQGQSVPYPPRSFGVGGADRNTSEGHGQTVVASKKFNAAFRAGDEQGAVDAARGYLKGVAAGGGTRGALAALHLRMRKNDDLAKLSDDEANVKGGRDYVDKELEGIPVRDPAKGKNPQTKGFVPSIAEEKKKDLNKSGLILLSMLDKDKKKGKKPYTGRDEGIRRSKLPPGAPGASKDGVGVQVDKKKQANKAAARGKVKGE